MLKEGEQSVPIDNNSRAVKIPDVQHEVRVATEQKPSDIQLIV